ncbi:AAA family ATPase [Pantoea agglomerans]|uniref:ATP-dependent nuclease n=1 Tax=Enterobacter agglomerans TaxID=549 RepID=UPI002A6B16CF|nr:AAA family ATPase [Pantoea agglomerans]MDY0999045.1 AAA family ATPase [Pantoea agglomerans]
MKYRDSQTDLSLRKWFSNSLDHALLRKVSLELGMLRSLSSFKIKIDYPLLAIAGRNGSGKSTLLAMIACAYHSDEDQHLLIGKRKPYYTFADFFIQHSDEVPQEGITIGYEIAYNDWRVSKRFPDGKGFGRQLRTKKKGGKWNNYDTRAHRQVIFLGIERIVPHSEKSQSKSYAKLFIFNGDALGCENEIRENVGYILNKKYDDFKFVSHSRYRLPIVKYEGKTISGFNMGAGENALFEIFSMLYSAEPGALIIVDEIELGLHAEAQVKLIERLKSASLKRKLQIIFTTHSDIIFGCIPDDARVYIENINSKTVIHTEISSEYAFGKLSSENSQELDILVEDIVASKLLSNILPSDVRSRLNIEVIGSASSLSRQMAAIFQRGLKKKIITIFDGDQKRLSKNNLNYACSMLERNQEEFTTWFSSNVTYLPGEEWPEKWIIRKNLEYVDNLSTLVNGDPDTTTAALTRGAGSEKHKELYEASLILGINESEMLDRCCINISMTCQESVKYLVEFIKNKLSE